VRASPQARRGDTPSTAEEKRKDHRQAIKGTYQQPTAGWKLVEQLQDSVKD